MLTIYDELLSSLIVDVDCVPDDDGFYPVSKSMSERIVRHALSNDKYPLLRDARHVASLYSKYMFDINIVFAPENVFLSLANGVGYTELLDRVFVKENIAKYVASAWEGLLTHGCSGYENIPLPDRNDENRTTPINNNALYESEDVAKQLAPDGLSPGYIVNECKVPHEPFQCIDTADPIRSMMFYLPTGYRHRAKWYISGFDGWTIRDLEEDGHKFVAEDHLHMVEGYGSPLPSRILHRPVEYCKNAKHSYPGRLSVILGDIDNAIVAIYNTGKTKVRILEEDGKRYFNFKMSIGGRVVDPMAVRLLKTVGVD